MDDKDSFWDLSYLNVAAIFTESSLGQTTQNTECANILGFIPLSVSTPIPPSPSPF